MALARSCRIANIVMLALVLAAAPARAADYCINAATGADANPGTCAQPWATLGPSQSYPFVAGDRVLIAAGRYFHPLTAWYMKPGVSWIGAGRESTTVVFDRLVAVPFVRFRTGSAGSGPPSDLRPGAFTASTVFADMTIENDGQATAGIDVVVTSADSAPTLRNVAIIDFPIGISLHPSSDERAAASTHAVITQCIIRGASDSGVLSFADVFYSKAVTEASSLTNVMARGTQHGAFVKTLINDIRDVAMATASPTLTNTTLVSTAGSPVLLQSWIDDGVTRAPTQLAAGSLAATITNSIMTGSTRYGIEEFSASTEPAAVTSNSLGGNTLGDYLDEGSTVRAASAVGVGNLSVIPLFVSAATGDLHVLGTSPTLERLTPASGPTTDIDGHARPQQPMSDIGADEWVPCTAIADASASVQGAPCTGQSSTLDASRSSIGSACTAGFLTQWFQGATLLSTSPIFGVNPAMPTTYRLHVSCRDPALSACFGETTITIQPSTAAPTANAGIAQSSCGAAGATIVFNIAGSATAQAPSTIASSTWSATGGSIASPSSLATTLSVVASGARQDIVATLDVIDSAGCTARSPVTLTLLPMPSVSIADPGTQCVVPSVSTVIVPIVGSASGGTGSLAWAWTSSEGMVTGAANAVLSVPAEAFTRTVTVSALITDDAGCTASASRVVTLIPRPTANAGSDIGRCGPPGPLSIPLDGTGSMGESPLSYQWSATSGTLSDPTAASPSLDLTVGGSVQDVTVTLVVSDPSGACTHSDQVMVSVGPGPVADAGADFDGCVTPGIASIPLDASGSSGTGTLRHAWTTSAGTIAAPASAVTRLDISVADLTLDIVVGVEVRDDSGGCVATDDKRIVLRPSPVAAPGAQYSVVRSGGATTDVPLDGTASLGEAPLSFAWTTTLGTFRDSGLTSSALPSPTIVVPDMPTVQRGNACLIVTAANGCVSSEVCAEVVLLLAPVNPPNDVGGTLRVFKDRPTNVLLQWQDSPVDATHDAAARHEAWVATRGCGAFTSLIDAIAQPGLNEAREPILTTAPPLRFYFIRSFNDGGASLPAAPDGTNCR